VIAAPLLAPWRPSAARGGPRGSSRRWWKWMSRAAAGLSGSTPGVGLPGRRTRCLAGTSAFTRFHDPCWPSPPQSSAHQRPGDRGVSPRLPAPWRRTRETLRERSKRALGGRRVAGGRVVCGSIAATGAQDEDGQEKLGFGREARSVVWHQTPSPPRPPPHRANLPALPGDGEASPGSICKDAALEWQRGLERRGGWARRIGRVGTAGVT